jgi:aprataxin
MLPLRHVHLHILSGDLVSPSLKNKKHYNSFHPSLGFFLHLEDVVSWFDLPQEAFDDVITIKLFLRPIATDPYLTQKIALPSKDYEPLLKQDLSCFKCGEEFKTIPKLKDHLQNEWENEGKKIKAREERKRKRDEEPAGGEAQDSAVEKQRRKTQNDGKETDQ